MTAQILVVDDEPDMKALVLQKFRHQIGHGAINFLFASASKHWRWHASHFRSSDATRP